MSQAHQLAARDRERVNAPDVLAVVPGLRVVDLVHAYGVGVVVDRHIDMAADGLLDAGGGAAAAGKQVDDQLGGQGQDELGGEHSNSKKERPARGGPQGGLLIAQTGDGIGVAWPTQCGDSVTSSGSNASNSEGIVASRSAARR